MVKSEERVEIMEDGEGKVCMDEYFYFTICVLKESWLCRQKRSGVLERFKACSKGALWWEASKNKPKNKRSKADFLKQ